MYDIIWILCDITTTFTDIKRLYSWHHIHNIPEYRTDCIRHNTLHLWHHSHCNYDKTPAMFLTWYSVYMISHPLNEWQHKDCIWHDTQCICVIKPIWLMTSQPMYVWNHNHGMHDTIDTLPDITYTLADNIPLFYVMAQTLFMKSYVLYMMTPILCVWLTQLYIWLETC